MPEPSSAAHSGESGPGTREPSSRPAHDEAADDASASLPWESSWPPIRYWFKVALVVITIIIAVRMLAILQGVLIVLLASLVLAIGLQPAISWMEARRVPRAAALGLIMLGGMALAVGAGVLIVPVVVNQVQMLVEALPQWIDGLESDSPFVADLLDRVDPASGFSAAMANGEGALAVVGGALRSAFDLLLVLVLTPYFALALPGAKRWATRLLARDDRADFLHLLNRSTALMANYIAGNLLVSLIAGVVTYVGLIAIGVPYPAALAVFVAVTDMVPAVGATIGAAAVIAVAASEGPVAAILAVVLTVGYQQVENFYIVPRVMRDAIDVTPATGIVALLVGATLAGPIGALLALPLVAMLQVIVEYFLLDKRIEAVRRSDAAHEGIVRHRLRRQRRALP